MLQKYSQFANQKDFKNIEIGVFTPEDYLKTKTTNSISNINSASS